MCLVWSIQACNRLDSSTIAKQPPGIYNGQIAQQIAIGKKLENVSSDSLMIVAQKLYQLNTLSADKTALVYAEVFEATFLWQAAKHKEAMRMAVQALAHAQRLGVNRALPQIYALIGNLHKETTNFILAFGAADNGLNAAITNKDTASIIALLGLKAMFTRSLGLNNHQSKLDENSIALNLKALKMAESNPKYERLRIRFYDNIAQYYKDKRDFDKTLYYGNKGVDLANKYHQNRSLTYGYCWLGQAVYFHGEQEKGIAYLNKALQIAKDLHQPYRVMEINGAFYECYFSSGNYKEAILYNTRSRNMRDSLKVLDNVKQISELQLKYESAQKDKKISSLKAKAQIKNMLLYSVSIIVLLLVIISLLIYIKGNKSKQLLLSEKYLVDKELKNATLELLYFTENLKQKNEIIEEFKAEIEHLQFESVNEADSKNLDKLLQAHLMTDESWYNFKTLFAKVHSKFFATLKQKFPNLTATDTRILCLIKLQLSNREMAAILGITIEGIRKSRHRLRKKMNLPESESIEDAIATF